MAEKIVTENEYPISNRWLIKNCKTLWGSPFILVFFLAGIISPAILVGSGNEAPDIMALTIFAVAMFGFYIFVSVFEYLFNYLRRRFFHYSVSEDNMQIQSGIISRQERHMPYSRLQNVLIKQDLLDRLFGLKQVIVENAAGAGDMNLGTGTIGATWGVNNRMDSLGNSGNALTIPGLTKEDAEKLKQIILDKMIEHSKEDKNSGL